MARQPIHCRFCDVRALEGQSLPGLCPIGRGGEHSPEPVPLDLLGDPVPPTGAAPSPQASDAGRTLRAHRRDALEAGRQRGAKAARHADAEHEEWTHRASDFVVEHGGANKEFLIEDVRVFAESKGLPPPPDQRAWGGVASRMVRKNQLVRVRFDTDGYGSPKSVWRLA